MLYEAKQGVNNTSGSSFLPLGLTFTVEFCEATVDFSSSTTFDTCVTGCPCIVGTEDVIQG
jgi:hypothetical protein